MHRNKMSTSKTPKVPISEEEKLFILNLEAKYLLGNKHITKKDFPDSKASDSDMALNFGRRFENLGLLHGTVEGKYEIQKKVVTVAHKLKHPPTKDYWITIGIWFRSKWWSIPFLLVMIGTPLVAQWIQIIRFLWNLFAGTS